MILLLKNILEFLYKAASAALFGILLLLAFMLTANMGSEAFYGLFRYDYLLLYALIIQFCLLYLKLESWAEAKVIALFHVMAMLMEIFLTHPAIASWQYPQPAVFKILTVPLFAGFMYSAVGSFFARSLRLYQVVFTHLPGFLPMLVLALLSYINFMSKFFIPDIRYLLFFWSIALFWKTRVYFQLSYSRFELPMLPVLLILAFIIWIAENISTFYKIWLYPSQVDAWHMVGWGKLGSWYLLLLLSLVLGLKILGNRDGQGRWQLKKTADK
ncbi:DUF817 family protein [Acinetobacter radioresistens]|jgi:uncharacterized membrane protein YoaT (DUF817 family)|uniref:DUF817 domain-containing protein n=2 Tax=Bacteria TaxID=2 RepID=A0ABM9YRH6_ACIRA|nr:MULTISPECIES: DUF817 family protein [Acinetobacter]EET83598.1 hypothetical protein ACIRA0001_2392 [Acinetobacter radioresistens SK82]ENV86684.1 hypothetical protein F940_00641 [Acinetobacter radioresistens NIPH 2130]EXE60969.1 hypothetical protein J579_0296 [Acinetobacter sp. 1239920]MBA5696409.1 DUF817 domain-containing protein [Acinetobacter radioresistens]MBA5700201.1 DUF817 domain-containing protein [Acinetobacter radioresistens]